MLIQLNSFVSLLAGMSLLLATGMLPSTSTAMVAPVDSITGVSQHPLPSTSVPTPETTPIEAAMDNADSLTAAGRKVKLTYYWIMFQKQSDVGDVVLGTCDGRPLAHVTKSFADRTKMEGSARLLNGKYINLGSCSCKNYMCFQETDSPLGSNDNPLVPYSSIAVNDVKYGQTVFVPQFKGVVLPNGKVHNGCVRADDESWSFGGGQIDWYVVDEANYETLDNKLKLNK
ncbi:hypothetical protein H4R33_005488, partial [Dimargaris cristalligena]